MSIVIIDAVHHLRLRGTELQLIAKQFLLSLFGGWVGILVMGHWGCQGTRLMQHKTIADVEIST